MPPRRHSYNPSTRSPLGQFATNQSQVSTPIQSDDEHSTERSQPSVSPVGSNDSDPGRMTVSDEDESQDATHRARSSLDIQPRHLVRRAGNIDMFRDQFNTALSEVMEHDLQPTTYAGQIGQSTKAPLYRHPHSAGNSQQRSSVNHTNSPSSSVPSSQQGYATKRRRQYQSSGTQTSTSLPRPRPRTPPGFPPGMSTRSGYADGVNFPEGLTQDNQWRKPWESH